MIGRPREYNHENIARLIRLAITNEQSFAPISDRSLVEFIAQEGEECSRSTVYHIRRALGLPSVRERRKQYRAEREELNNAR